MQKFTKAIWKISILCNFHRLARKYFILCILYFDFFFLNICTFICPYTAEDLREKFTWVWSISLASNEVKGNYKMVTNTFRISGQRGFYGTKHPISKSGCWRHSVLLLSLRLIPVWWCSFKVYVRVTFISPCSSEGPQGHGKKGHIAYCCCNKFSYWRNCTLSSCTGEQNNIFSPPALYYFAKARWQCKLI